MRVNFFGDLLRRCETSKSQISSKLIFLYEKNDFDEVSENLSTLRKMF